jgi:hypothetical protein
MTFINNIVQVRQNYIYMEVIALELMNIKKVEDLTIMSDVNKRLEQGWVLIGTYTNNYDPHAYPTENTFHYVVGFPDGTGYVDTAQNTNYDHSEDLKMETAIF